MHTPSLSFSQCRYTFHCFWLKSWSGYVPIYSYQCMLDILNSWLVLFTGMSKYFIGAWHVVLIHCGQELLTVSLVCCTRWSCFSVISTFKVGHVPNFYMATCHQPIQKIPSIYEWGGQSRLFIYPCLGDNSRYSMSLHQTDQMWMQVCQRMHHLEIYTLVYVLIFTDVHGTAL